MSVSKHGLRRSARAHGEKQGPRAYAKVLESLRCGHTPKEAAANAGVSRQSIFNWRKEDEQFAADWEAAVDEGVDVLEAECYRRGIKGVAKPVFQQGTCVGHVQEYSDTLLVLMLKGRRPERYNTDRVQHTGGDGGPIQTQADVTVRFVAAPKRKDD